VVVDLLPLGWASVFCSWSSSLCRCGGGGSDERALAGWVACPAVRWLTAMDGACGYSVLQYRPPGTAGFLFGRQRRWFSWFGRCPRGAAAPFVVFSRSGGPSAALVARALGGYWGTGKSRHLFVR
jgi:hypothetical protein